MKTFKQLLEAKHPDSVKKVWSTGKHAYATTKAGETYKLNHSKLNGNLPQVGDLLIKGHHTLKEELDESVSTGSFYTRHHDGAVGKVKKVNDDQVTIKYNKGDEEEHDIEHFKKSHKKFNEEVEQLDELSKKTLGSYIKKASDSKASSAIGIVSKKDKEQDIAANKYLNRHNGISKAVKKLVGEEVIGEEVHTVDIDHEGGVDRAAKKHQITLKKHGSSPYAHKASGTKENLRKYLTHHYGSKSDAKDVHPEVFNEEVEQLDELSKKTLGSYIKKATDKVSSHSYTHGYYDRDRGDSGTNHSSEKKTIDALHKSQKRERGIKKAVNKLTKEGMEHDHIQQTLADKDINSKVENGKIVVHKDNVIRAKNHVKKLGHKTEVVSGLNEEGCAMKKAKLKEIINKRIKVQEK